MFVSAIAWKLVPEPALFPTRVGVEERPQGQPGQLRQTVPVQEAFRSKTVWRGEVEIFDLSGRRQAERCYAWSHREGPDDQGQRFVAVLELPPVASPETAVKVAVVAEIKGKK